MPLQILRNPGLLAKHCGRWVVLLCCLLWVIGLPLNGQAGDLETNPHEGVVAAGAPGKRPADKQATATSNHSQIDFLVTRIHLLGTQQQEHKSGFASHAEAKATEGSTGQGSPGNANESPSQSKRPGQTLIRTTYSATRHPVVDQHSQNISRQRVDRTETPHSVSGLPVKAPQSLGALQFTAARSRTTSLFPVLVSERFVRALR